MEKGNIYSLHVLPLSLQVTATPLQADDGGVLGSQRPVAGHDLPQ